MWTYIHTHVRRFSSKEMTTWWAWWTKKLIDIWITTSKECFIFFWSISEDIANENWLFCEAYDDFFPLIIHFFSKNKMKHLNKHEIFHIPLFPQLTKSHIFICGKSVRPSPLFTKQNKFMRKQCSLLTRLWVWRVDLWWHLSCPSCMFIFKHLYFKV